MSKKSNNPLDHVRVKQRGASWAYYFEKAKVAAKVADMPQSRMHAWPESRHIMLTSAAVQR